MANGDNAKVEALSDITFHLFYNMGFKYETKRGAPSYYVKSKFDLSSYLVHSRTSVNCYDQAYGVATIGNLLGINSTPVFTEPFGFINLVNIVGVGPCNNPFYMGPYTTVHIPVAGQDDANRSSFGNHMYVYAEGRVFDACAGAELGIQENILYLRSIIDCSTDVEMASSFFCATQRKCQFKSQSYALK